MSRRKRGRTKTEAQPSTARSTSGDSRALQILGAKWWQGVAAIVAVAGVVVAVAAARTDDTKPPTTPAPSESTPPVPTPGRNQSVSGDGNCVVQGDGNDVVCVPAARSFGWADLSTHGFIHAYFEGGSAADLPTPPAYPRESAQAHCAEWAQWIADSPRMYTVGQGLRLGMSAGTNDLVVVRDVRAKVFTKKAAAAGTTIKCNYGGGSNAGVGVVVDTVAQQTHFTPFDTDEKTLMPPGTLSMGLSDAGFSDASIAVTGEDGYLYEGQIVVEALVNNEPQTLTWGSYEKPFRWISDSSGRFAKDDGSEYDWHPIEKRWVQGMDPFTLPDY
ncbi:hypothetical protein ACIBCR_19270 [Micromonospora echinospora]|uniref:hypothetical protein n=1 Tax=Micromonospora echinospora TaxID=1877 RepID=UPI00379D2E06